MRDAEADDPRFAAWVATLERRCLADLTFPEVTRALRALSSTYVERRDRLRQGAALSGTGKRAAFALFYGPLHYLIVRHIAAALLAGRHHGIATIVDLGCGTGAAGAACASACTPSPLVVGVDRHPWALTEAARTYREFGLQGRTEKADIAASAWIGRAKAAPRPARTFFVAAFALNELSDASRETVLRRLIERARGGDAALVVEPLAGFVAPWWSEWRPAIEQAGGRADEWRTRVDLPPIVAKLDRAAGLDHRELTARSLSINCALRHS
jgi:hypothetical protein